MYEIKVKFQDNEMVIQYKGSLKGNNEMKLTAELPNGGDPIQWAAKRQ